MTHNPYKVVIDFENIIAEYASAKYAIAVESGTAAIFLSLMYRNLKGENIWIPTRTYPSVPCSIIHAGGKVVFTKDDWEGIYELAPWGIWDGALRFKQNMYKGGLHCLSFHIKKHLSIGRGGMILTDDEKADKWLRKARFDGREPKPLLEDNFTMLGFNMYMEPSQAARGIQLFEVIKNKQLEDLIVKDQGYPDLSKFPIYQK